jgi:hypothetical protein
MSRMRPRQFLSKHNVTLTVLFAIMMRASVATGWMLQIPTGEGLAAPVLAICPQQSPALAAWLAHGQSTHAHHHHADDNPQTDVSVTVADPACALWAGSAVATTIGASNAFSVAPGAPTPPVAHTPAPPRTRPSSHRARAPPSLQSV